jgi:hypothetical protein
VALGLTTCILPKADEETLSRYCTYLAANLSLPFTAFPRVVGLTVGEGRGEKHHDERPPLPRNSASRRRSMSASGF